MSSMLAGLFALLTFVGTAQAPAADPVRIDVIARDAQGRPVDSLTAPDFELREDGAPQVLTGAEPVRKPRIIGIYLDEYYVTGSRTAVVRETLHRFIDGLAAADQVAILRPLDSLLKISLTSDKAALHRAVDAFEGRRGDYTPRTDLERSLVAGDRTRADAQRTQSTWSTLNALTLHLGNLAAGRTSLLLVSEMAEPVVRRRGVDGLPTSSSITRAANRANVSIYVFDPRTKAEAQAAADEGPNLLEVLASDSDGAMITGPADAPDGLKRMLADASSYYLLSYRSTHGRDGLFHTVDVSVKRKGVIVRSRPGFWSPTPEEIDRAKLLTGGAVRLPPIKLEPARHASTLIRPWFGIARADNGKIRLTFVWEAAGAIPGDRRVKTPAAMDVKAVANGVTVFEGTVRDHASAVFDVPPGRVTLTSAIQDSASQTIDHDLRDVIVRDLKGPVVLGTPEVFRGRTARDLRELREDAAPVPVASREFSRAESLVIRVPAYGGAQPPALTATLVSPAGQPMRQLTIEQATASTPTAQIDLPLAGLPPGQYRVDMAARGTSGSAKDSLSFRIAD